MQPRDYLFLAITILCIGGLLAYVILSKKDGDDKDDYYDNGQETGY